MTSINDLKTRKIAIFGTGLDGVKCAYYLHNQRISIKCFLNNNSKIEAFMGYPVYEPNNIKVSDKDYVIIAVGAISTYLMLAEQLSKMGMEEFKDFIYYKWIGKKIVLLHGNCHMVVIGSYLESSNKFSRKYAIYPNPCICDNKDGYIKDQVFENCDVWIHEDIRKDIEYGYYLSDEHMPNCFLEKGKSPKEIIVPHLFGLGKAFFPQSDCNNSNEEINNGRDRNGMFPHADTVIDKCVGEGKKVEDIIKYCKSDAALNGDYIRKNFTEYMERIRKREESWSIKMYDFILDNYQKEKLFYDERHPTNIIMKKIVVDILQVLAIREDYIDTDIEMDTHENPVYPCVRHELNLDWKDGEIRKSRAAKKMIGRMDFEEYIREYLLWSYKISD